MTPTITSEVQQFASAVRSRLHDLPEETVDELTEGLEADLAERLEERGGDLGDASAYADELRAAAGLPTRRWTLSIEDGRALTEAREFLASIAPAWWVLRGIGVGLLPGLLFLSGAAWVTAALVLAMVVVSVQWGRGRWVPRRDVAAMSLAFGLLAVLGGGLTASYAQFAMSQGPTWEQTAGIWMNGAPVANIQAYSCEGEPLDAVQLFDGFGNPLSVEPGIAESKIGDTAPNRATGDEPLWNVYPLVDYGPDGGTTDRVPALKDCAVPERSADDER